MSVDQRIVVVYGISVNGTETVVELIEERFSSITGERLLDKITKKKRIVFPDWIKPLLFERESAQEGDWLKFKTYQSRPVIAYPIDSMGESSGVVLVGKLLLENDVHDLKNSYSLKLPNEEDSKIIHAKLDSYGEVGVQLGCRWS